MWFAIRGRGGDSGSSDGTRGLLKMKQSGARTIARDEASSVVFGMPKEAIGLVAVDQIASLSG
jgi:two-component system chemotaxis response regulator CheB